MDWIYLLEWLALLSTLILHITPSLHVKQMLKKNSTEEMPFVLFLLNILCCLQFGHIAYLQGHKHFLLLNLSGFLFNTFYAIAYTHVSDNKRSCTLCVIIAANYIFFLNYHLLQNYANTKEFVEFLTFSSAILLTVVSLFPLLDVIKFWWHEKATPSSHLLQGLILFNATTLVLYGHMLNSLYVSLPNLVGLLVQMARSAAVAVYADSAAVKKKKKKKE